MHAPSSGCRDTYGDIPPAVFSSILLRQAAAAAAVSAAVRLRAREAADGAAAVALGVRVGASGLLATRLLQAHPQRQHTAARGGGVPPRRPSSVEPQRSRRLLASAAAHASRKPSHASRFKQSDKHKADVSTHDEHIEEGCFADLEALGLIRTHF